jgi:hypothetical protein
MTTSGRTCPLCGQITTRRSWAICSGLECLTLASFWLAHLDELIVSDLPIVQPRDAAVGQL